jgi:hypothetical protein
MARILSPTLSPEDPAAKKPGLLEMPVLDEPQAVVLERADVVPVDGFVIEVDGRLKQRFDDKSAAQNAALQLKQRFSMLQVRVYDAIEKSRALIDASGVALV